MTQVISSIIDEMIKVVSFNIVGISLGYLILLWMILLFFYVACGDEEEEY